MSETTLTTPANGVAAPETKTYRPQIDVYETDDQFVVVADVPGVSEEDIELTFEKEILSLHAHVSQPQFEGYEPRWKGYGIGDWKRSLRLTEAIDHEGIEAAVKDGVLKVTLPKSRESLKKSIPVKRLD